MIYIFWTCRSLEEGKTIARGLLEARLIACASFIPRIDSLYIWEGKLEETSETKAILKTDARHFEAVSQYILSHCSYEIPEICAIPIELGHPPYLKWVSEAVISRS